MKLNDQLAMTIPLYRDDMVYAWVHSTPIGRDVFKANYKLLAKTYDGVTDLGRTGPRMAIEVMEDVARDMAGPGNDTAGLTTALLNEIRRLSNVLVATPRGWDTIPLQDAMDHKGLDSGDIEEVMCAVVFFTVVWHVFPRQGRGWMMEQTCGLWGAAMSSLNVTAFIESLRTSTATASSGATESAIPPGIIQITAADGSIQTASLPV